MTRRLFCLALGIVLLASMPFAYAQFATISIVNDPLNLVQNTATALRSFISNANEVTQINNQIQSLANEARQLVTLPLTLVNEIDTAIGQYTSLLNQGQGMAYQITASVQQFEALYAEGFGGNGTFMQRAKRLAGQVRDAGRLSTQVTSVFDRLCAQQTRVSRLLAASQAAVGTLQAEQAANQLTGVLAEQQVSIQEILAANQRLQVSESLRQLVLEEQAQGNAQAYVQGMVITPVQGPGVGGGVTLPE